MLKNTNFVLDLEFIDYSLAYNLQKQAVADVIAGGPERVLLCEHPSVLTLGRMADEKYVLASREELHHRGISVLAIDRGGEVTLHAPGQLVVYPILDLKKHGKDLKAYMRQLEEIAIQFLALYGCLASRNPGKTGVWIGSKKIVSIGVGVKKWVTYHGLGININTDLKLFSLINPCGLGVNMTSIEELNGQSVDFKKAKKDFADVFVKHFALERT